MIRILSIILALIVYGSLYPWRVEAAHAHPLAWVPSDLGDIVVNVMLYIPVGMFAFFALDRRGHRRLRWILPIALSAVVSASIEYLQIFDVSRVSSLIDVLDNTLGGAIGVVLGWLLRDAISGPILLAMYWLGYVLTAGKGSIPRSPVEAVTFVFAWMLVLGLLFVRSKAWLARATAVAFSLLLIVRGLEPFHIKATPSHFDWIPFDAMFAADWIVGLPVFLQKSFLYGAAIWLWRAAGLSWATSTAIVAVYLAAIEVIQLYLPGRTSEITDPLLAIILGVILMLLEHEQRFAMLRVQT